MELPKLLPTRKFGLKGEVVNYTCPWCGGEFGQRVGTSDSYNGERKTVSSQVRCPLCKNFMPTWGQRTMRGKR